MNSRKMRTPRNNSSRRSLRPSSSLDSSPGGGRLPQRQRDVLPLPLKRVTTNSPGKGILGTRPAPIDRLAFGEPVRFGGLSSELDYLLPGLGESNAHYPRDRSR